MLNSALWDIIKQRKSAIKPTKSIITILPRKIGKKRILVICQGKGVEVIKLASFEVLSYKF